MAKKPLKKSEVYDEKSYFKYMNQEEKKAKQQSKVGIKAGDTVRFTKPRKNEYGEWVVKVYVNGKVYLPGEIFATDKQEALDTIEDSTRRFKERGITVITDTPAVKNPLREEILEMSGVLLEKKGDYEIYHSTYTSAIQEAERYCEEQGFYWNKDESFAKIGSGPRKPQEGKTNKFSLELYTKEGKPAGKAVHFQVYGMGDRYELNAYLSPMKKKDYQYYEGDE
jgi:hypothetical protein